MSSALWAAGWMLVGYGGGHLVEWCVRELRRRRRRGGDQWFAPQKALGHPPGPAPAQHPAPRAIKGQRPSEGRHRPKQKVARFVQRTRRFKQPR